MRTPGQAGVSAATHSPGWLRLAAVSAAAGALAAGGTGADAGGSASGQGGSLSGPGNPVAERCRWRHVQPPA